MPADGEALPWGRLREASEKIGPAVTKLVAYNLDYAHGGPSERRPRLVDVIQN
jgi:hypothetical protein